MQFQLPERTDGQVRVRVVVDGSTEAGRRYLRGVMRYARAHTRWVLLVEMEPARRKGAEWALDEACIYASHDLALLERVMARRIPVVGCQAHHEHLGIPVVRSDDHAVGVMAAEYFLERGFSQFVFEGAGDTSLAAKLRHQGFSQAAAGKGFAIQRHDLYEGAVEQTWIARHEHLARQLTAMPKPVALFCGHDTIARGGADFLLSAGLALPEQVAMLGVDNDELQCDICQPSLSSVELPQADIGHAAAGVLDRILQGKRPPTADGPVLFKPTGVVTRESTDIIAFDEPRLAEALKYMRQHACDPCSVEDVLNHVVVSRRWLEGQFRKRFNRSPHDEITRIRMERAKYLLRDPHLTLKQIADRSGYGHVQNFVAVFRQSTGQTPAAYRRALQSPGDGPR